VYTGREFRIGWWGVDGYGKGCRRPNGSKVAPPAAYY